MSADLHWAWTSLVLSFWLKPCFVFFIQIFFHFANFVFLHFTCCFAWFLASHTHSSVSPNTIVPSLPSPPTPLPLRHPPRFLITTHHRCPDSWADSRVRSTRSMGGAAHTPSKLLLSDLPPGSGQARGLSAGIHPSPDQPTPVYPISMEPDLSHTIKTAGIKCLIIRNLILFSKSFDRLF